MNTDDLKNESQPSCLGAVSFQLFQELYGSYVQMDDRFESVHIWSEELALRNKGRWTPILISKAKYVFSSIEEAVKELGLSKRVRWKNYLGYLCRYTKKDICPEFVVKDGLPVQINGR